MSYKRNLDFGESVISAMYFSLHNDKTRCNIHYIYHISHDARSDEIGMD